MKVNALGVKIMQKKYLWLLPLLVFLFLSISCSTTKQAAQKDPFLEKWETMAQESKGHSPVQRVREIEIPEIKESEEPPPRPLPTLRVNLNMRDTDVKAILRALARISGTHLVINQELKGLITLNFKDIPWDQAFMGILRSQGLSYTWEGEIIRVMTIEDLERDLRIAAANEKRLAQQQGVRLIEPLLTVMVNVDYADAKLLKENIQEFLTKDAAGKPRGSIRVDEHTNALIIQAIREDIKRIAPIIEKIDKPAYQILIKANIVETTKDTARNLGIQWGGIWGQKIGDQGLWITPGGTGNVPGATTPPGQAFSGGYEPASGARGIGGHGFGVNFPVAAASAAASGSLGMMFGAIGGNILEIQLNALQKEGKVNILSSPSITTLDNQKAFTENGERIPFVTTDKDGQRTVNFQDAVLRLEITPHVIDGRNLKMKILIKKDEVDRSRTVEGNPFIVKKLTETTLIVNDGETIVISGLTKHKREDSDAGIPFLMQIPFLRWLFKAEGKHNTMEEVLIFITPSILPPRLAAASPVAKPEVR